ncbi:hypothetical protein C5F47_04315 [Nitrosopumilus cobalaminigenes]|uniref:Uncharacterized protein n=1 Tax=Nitrosopumilus cobalaminigenes TaxID=1470066 RepID=A0A7D5M0H9_9ARCH|nr:hypothetical protein [Nitrosopumilus cobalaminigenes]QLH02831.1 hypothetical protein C5F47_04315 [Nitrosopumilus cobalaminigenes]
MRTSLKIMLGGTAIWVMFGLAIAPQEVIDEFGYAESIGSLMGGLFFPWIGFTVYYFLTRNKTKTKKTSV